ncbi:MAG: rod shape-determining protein MreC [Gammaproteobacteria bacterium]|nr:rod shape-determining protein MreC [Gammaproteobacteria bacterium]
MALVIASLVLMVVDHQYQYLAQSRSVLTSFISPIRTMVDAPARLINWVGNNFSEQQNYAAENIHLKTEQLILRAKLQKLGALRQENDQLRALLSASQKVSGKMLVAELLAVDLAPFTRQVVLNRGQKDHVVVGQAVLDAYGVMGQVIEVNHDSSRVLLISDSRSAVPVQSTRTGSRAIAAGQGVSNDLQLLFVPDTADFQVGDSLETSGLGNRFPVSYPVGVVSEVVHRPGERFSQITVYPSAHLDSSRQVLLVWPSG